MSNANDRPETSTAPARRSLLRRKRFWFAAVAVLLAAALGVHEWQTWRSPMPPTPIFQGVSYCCEIIPQQLDGGGKVCVVEADLSVPGVSVYTTPLDPAAVAKGWEYQMSYPGLVVDQQNLAAAVNGTIFGASAFKGLAPFVDASAVESIISDHQLNHAYQYDRMICFDDAGASWLTARPPTAEDIARARWGIGSQAPVLVDGQIDGRIEPRIDHRTALAINPARRLLWLACFEEASGRLVGQYFLDKGATDAILLDGGHSSSMAIGRDARNVEPGTVVTYYIPVANFFGIRARPLNP